MVADLRDRRHGDTSRPPWHQQCRIGRSRAAIGWRRPAERQQVCRVVGIADPGLSAAHQPPACGLHAAGRHGTRIRTGRGLCQGECNQRLAREDSRKQVTLLRGRSCDDDGHGPEADEPVDDRTGKEGVRRDRLLNPAHRRPGEAEPSKRLGNRCPDEAECGEVRDEVVGRNMLLITSPDLVWRQPAAKQRLNRPDDLLETVLAHR